MQKDRLRNFFHFTLTEILIVIFIMSIGAAMLLPALAQARKKAGAAVCINNLKQPLAMIQMYSIDYAEIPIKYYSKSLLAAGYISERNYLSLICPDWEPRRELGDHPQVYGMRQTQELTYPFARINHPSTHVLLADSIRLDPADAKDGMKQYFTFYGTVGQYKNRVHCRHSRKANVGFMDGHVRPCSGKELQELKCPKYCYCPNPCSEHAPL